MDFSLFYAVGGMFLLLLAGAFFSGSETALTAVSRGRMHQLEKHGIRSAAKVNRLVANRERMIGAVLLGNTFINILASSLATSLLDTHFGPKAVAVSTGLMTVIILIFVEVLPKTLAIARTDRFALAVATPLLWVVGILAPIVGAVQWLVWRVLFLFGVNGEQTNEEVSEAAHEDIRGSVALHHQEGGVEREHRNMLSGILDLRELQVGDVALHRTSMISVDADLTPQEILDAAMASQHTRLPLWRGEQENIIGVLHTKHLVQALLENKGNIASIDIVSLAVQPWFVPDTTTLEEQLEAFRERRSHFALVVDEYGALRGLVTLEDILSEIIGELPEDIDGDGRSESTRLNSSHRCLSRMPSSA